MIALQKKTFVKVKTWECCFFLTQMTDQQAHKTSFHAYWNYISHV